MPLLKQTHTRVQKHGYYCRSNGVLIHSSYRPLLPPKTKKLDKENDAIRDSNLFKKCFYFLDEHFLHRGSQWRSPPAAYGWSVMLFRAKFSIKSHPQIVRHNPDGISQMSSVFSWFPAVVKCSIMTIVDDAKFGVNQFPFYYHISITLHIHTTTFPSITCCVWFNDSRHRTGLRFRTGRLRCSCT